MTVVSATQMAIALAYDEAHDALLCPFKQQGDRIGGHQYEKRIHEQKMAASVLRCERRLAPPLKMAG